MSDIDRLEYLSGQLHQGAQKFAHTAQTLRQQAQSLDWSAQDLASGTDAWAGTGSQNFTAAWNHYHNSTQKSATALDNTSQALSKLAQKIDDSVQQMRAAQAEQAGGFLLTGLLFIADVAQGGLDPVTDGLTVAVGADAAVAEGADAADTAIDEVDTETAKDLDGFMGEIDNTADAGDIAADSGGDPGDISFGDGGINDGGSGEPPSEGGSGNGSDGGDGGSGGSDGGGGGDDDGGGNSDVGGNGGGSFRRDITSTSELDPNLPSELNDGETINSGGRSGGARPLNGPPNSYVTTSGGHTLVYDSDGRLIYDISGERVKMTVWDQAPNGRLFPRDVKLVGPVPPEYLLLLP